jgi:hypothetical protein
MPVMAGHASGKEFDEETKPVAGYIADCAMPADAEMEKSCTGVIQIGIFAAKTFAETRHSKPQLCVQGDPAALRPAVIQWLNEHPQPADKTGGPAVLTALLKLYPCPGGN